MNRYLYTYDLIQKAEQKTFETSNSFRVMEEAAKACFKYIINEYNSKKILALCGPGNNGGDGILIAQYLLKESFLG